MPSVVGRGVTRRAFLGGGAALLLAARRAAAAPPASAGPPAPELIENLVAANRILADQGVLDGYGHVSARHDRDPGRYLLSRSRAPELVTADDIMELDLDSVPVDLRGRSMYLERFIHGEIYKTRPDVKAVVHHHSPSVIPFGASSVALRPLYHMAAFLIDAVPVFDIRAAAGGMTDMLVSTPALGQALARALGPRAAVLMRGHGAAVVGDSLIQAVARSVYMEVNARLQAQAIALGGEIRYLDPEEGAPPGAGGDRPHARAALGALEAQGAGEVAAPHAAAMQATPASTAPAPSRSGASGPSSSHRCPGPARGVALTEHSPPLGGRRSSDGGFGGRRARAAADWLAAAFARARPAFVGGVAHAGVRVGRSALSSLRRPPADRGRAHAS